MSKFTSRTSQRQTRGFTLIELLVVIAIIGILASIVLASLDSARKKGRDARRIADIKQLQLALELYYDACGAFPINISSSNSTSGCGSNNTAGSLVTNGYISVIPSDPSAGTYAYVAYSTTPANTSCISYHLGATLETAGHTAFATDSDTASVPTGFAVCTGVTHNGGGGAGTDFPGGPDSGGGAVTSCAGAGNSAGGGCFDVRP